MLNRLSALFAQRELLRRILGNTFWQMLEKILRIVSALVVGIWIARYLGPEGFGLLNFAIAFVALFTAFAELGLQAVVVRDLVRRPQLRGTIISSAFYLRLVGAAVAGILAILGIFFYRPDDGDAHILVLIIALAMFPQAWDVIDYDYQARMQAPPIVIIRSISLVVFAAVRIGLIAAGMQLTWFAWVIVGEAGLSALLMTVFARSRLRLFELSDASWSEAKYLLKSSWPLAIAGLSVMLYMRIDQVMLGKMLDDHAVGLFSAAVRISEAWYFIPMAILSAVAPALTAAYGGAEKGYYDKLAMFLRLMFWLGVFVALLLSLFSEEIIALLYGADYIEASSVLALHAWTGVFASLGVASGPWFVNAGLANFRMLHTIVGAIVNLTLNIYAIPRYGIIGAATATVISQCLAAFVLNGFAKRTWPIFILQARSMAMR